MFDTTSIRVRLIIAAIAVILVALQVAGVALFFTYERSVYRQVDLDLQADVDQLTALLTPGEPGKPSLSGELTDPRFVRPLSGRYWQISSGGVRVLASTSLWDEGLLLPPGAGRSGGYDRLPLLGPTQQRLYGVVRTVDFGENADKAVGTTYQILVAVDQAEIDALEADYRSDLIKALGGLAALLIAASWVQVSVGLHPLEQLRRGLASVRTGETSRLATNFPTEVRPLIEETNRLLENRDEAIRKARARAGDLAHGLKTPLTAIAMQIANVNGDASPGIAQDIEFHLARINGHIERELALSRLAAHAQAPHRTELAGVVGGLMRTLQRLPRGETITWLVDIPPGLLTGVDATDLTELLGNILDNAQKWAAAGILIRATPQGAMIRIDIEDDGSGIASDQREEALKRGIRLDETRPGSGLGLAIAKEMAEAYGGGIELSEAGLGGLCARVTVPAAAGALRVPVR